MIFPSAVLFFSASNGSDLRLFILGLWLEDREVGGNGEGREETEVLAGALRIPRGSLRLVWDMRRTEPGRTLYQPLADPYPILSTLQALKP